MKLKELYTINSQRSFLISLLVHSVFLFIIATATLTITTPEGFVGDGEIEITDLTGTGPKDSAESEVKSMDLTPVETFKENKPNSEKSSDKTPTEAEKIAQPVIEKQTEPLPPKKSAPTQPTKLTKELPKKLPAKVAVVDEASPVTAKDIEPVVIDKSKWTPVEDTDIDDSSGTTRGTHASSDEEMAEPAESSDDQAGNPKDPDDTEGGGNEDQDYSGPIKSDKELTAQAGQSYTYPFTARVRRLEGAVIIRFTLHPNGGVNKVWVFKSSGSGVLDNSALEGHAKWKYTEGADGVFQKKVVFSLKGPITKVPKE